MRELADLLPELAPPAGGLQRLQQRIATPTHAPLLSPPRRFGLSVLALGTLVLALALPSFIARQLSTEALTATLRQALMPPSGGIQVANGAALELSSAQPNVRIYLIQTSESLNQGTATTP